MDPVKPPSLPPVSAECVTTLQLAQPGAPPQQFTHKLARASDGRMRIDYGLTSVIMNPAAGKATLLDHVKKEVHTFPIPKGVPAEEPPSLTPPKLPGMPAPPALPKMSVKDLGKRMVDGHEVEGKLISMVAPNPPSPPAPAAIGGKPPAMPTPPQPPKSALASLVTEAWTSTKLHLPVLSRITGAFGKQTCHCKNLVSAEPPAAHFEVPRGYKPVGPSH
jgi:hypothetical protein